MANIQQGKNNGRERGKTAIKANDKGTHMNTKREKYVLYIHQNSIFLLPLYRAFLNSKKMFLCRCYCHCSSYSWPSLVLVFALFHSFFFFINNRASITTHNLFAFFPSSWNVISKYGKIDKHERSVYISWKFATHFNISSIKCMHKIWGRTAREGNERWGVEGRERLNAKEENKVFR